MALLAKGLKLQFCEALLKLSLIGFNGLRHALTLSGEMDSDSPVSTQSEHGLENHC